MKKILIALTDAGHGHRSASDALIKAIEKDYPGEFEVKAMDIFKVADITPFNTSDSTHKLVSTNPTAEVIFNFLFQLLNTEIGADLFKSYIIHRLYSAVEKILEKEAPDIVITVHPLVNTVIAEVRKRKENFKLYTVITDLVTLFRAWVNPNADLVFAPTLRAAKNVEQTVSEEKIISPLFPINPSMSEFKRDFEHELGFKERRPIILLTGGGVGATKLKDVTRDLDSQNKYNLIVICGRLDSLREALEDDYKSNTNVKVLGFVDNMQDYLNIADVVVGKPGPATILEIELFNKKAIFTKTIGQQEHGNIDYALENKNFVYINGDYSIISSKVEELLNQEEQSNPHKRKFNEASLILQEIIADYHGRAVNK